MSLAMSTEFFDAQNFNEIKKDHHAIAYLKIILKIN